MDLVNGGRRDSENSDQIAKQINERNSMAPDAIEHEVNMQCEPPMPLITIEEMMGKEVFKVNQEALNKLKLIDTPLAIFSMCGV